MKPKKREKAPSHFDLVGFWCDKLIGIGKITGADDLVHPRFTSEDRRLKAVCFACGHSDGVQVAHIVPHAQGGTMDLENLHVLCSACHRESENLSGILYWRWFSIAQFEGDLARYTRLVAKQLGFRSFAALAEAAESTYARFATEHDDPDKALELMTQEIAGEYLQHMKSLTA